jgi:hypothetical protein
VVVNGLPDPDPNTGLLPPGRYAADLAELYSRFVTAPRFVASTTRELLWDQWARHRAIVEAETGEIARMWLGGSFAGGKLDPDDVDVTYLLRAAVFDRLEAEELASLEDLTDRAWCVAHGMRIDSYVIRLPEDKPFWQLAPGSFTQATNDSFRDIGLYDEIWQCVRASPAEPAEPLRRGYVEVLL